VESLVPVASRADEDASVLKLLYDVLPDEKFQAAPVSERGNYVPTEAILDPWVPGNWRRRHHVLQEDGTKSYLQSSPRDVRKACGKMRERQLHEFDDEPEALAFHFEPRGRDVRGGLGFPRE
jgi:hypothetical protein